MTEFEIGLYVSVVLFILGSLISIFSSDIRARIANLSFKVSFPSKSRKDKRIRERIELLEELSSCQRAMLAYFATQAFLAIIFMAVVLFFGFMMVLRVHSVLSALSFLGFWCWFVVIVGTPFDVAVQLRKPEKTIERLRGELKPSNRNA